MYRIRLNSKQKVQPRTFTAGRRRGGGQCSVSCTRSYEIDETKVPACHMSHHADVTNIGKISAKQNPSLSSQIKYYDSLNKNHECLPGYICTLLCFSSPSWNLWGHTQPKVPFSNPMSFSGWCCWGGARSDEESHFSRGDSFLEPKESVVTFIESVRKTFFTTDTAATITFRIATPFSMSITSRVTTALQATLARYLIVVRRSQHDQKTLASSPPYLYKRLRWPTFYRPSRFIAIFTE